MNLKEAAKKLASLLLAEKHDFDAYYCERQLKFVFGNKTDFTDAEIQKKFELAKKTIAFQKDPAAQKQARINAVVAFWNNKRRNKL